MEDTTKWFCWDCGEPNDDTDKKCNLCGSEKEREFLITNLKIKKAKKLETLEVKELNSKLESLCAEQLNLIDEFSKAEKKSVELIKKSKVEIEKLSCDLHEALELLNRYIIEPDFSIVPLVKSFLSKANHRQTNKK